MVLITNVKYQNVYIFRPAKFGNGQIFKVSMLHIRKNLECVLIIEENIRNYLFWVVKNQEICK